LTGKNLFLIGREKVKAKGSNKAQIIEVVKRRIPIETIRQVTTSTKQVKHNHKHVQLIIEFVDLFHFLHNFNNRTISL